MVLRAVMWIVFILSLCVEANFGQAFSLLHSIQLLLKSKALQNVQILHVYTSAENKTTDSYKGERFFIIETKCIIIKMTSAFQLN